MSTPFSPFGLTCLFCVTTLVMDRASRVLAQALPAHLPRTYAALADWGDVPLTTIYHRAHGRRSKEEHAQSRQYLTAEEEKALVKFLLLISSLGHLVRIKFLPLLAFSIARRRSSVTPNDPIKPPGKNWPRAFEKRHPELKARCVVFPLTPLTSSSPAMLGLLLH
jgi:hypothetical protein